MLSEPHFANRDASAHKPHVLFACPPIAHASQVLEKMQKEDPEQYATVMKQLEEQLGGAAGPRPSQEAVS